ncbi:f-box domain-containing [Trichoderma cornu-damae]|uniref:F-box domain-containing n=1 Tax=Trichoderma cornu-damae TaxID=654480 RepID=A0A9P8QWI1_9HYPO|nr:f-box domain-containing [Trichoderma cornu-damae]
MASSTPQEAQVVTQTRLPLRLSTPGDACMDGAVSNSVTSNTAHESCQFATSAGGSGDVFSSPPGSCVGRERNKALAVLSSVWSPPCLETLPSEVLAHIASFLDVDDLLRASRTCHRLRTISLDPLLHHYRLRNARLLLPPLLNSPCRPSLHELMSRSIFMTNNTVISRRLARSLVSIRLSRRLASRPSARDLVQRCVLPQECVPGMFPVHVAPGLVAKRKAIEKERLKDGLRRWISGKWKGEVKEREEDARKYDETRGVGRVWRLRRFWERMSRGELSAHQNRSSRGSVETPAG